LSPHLREGSQEAASPPAAEPVTAQASAREPEQARDLAASLQSGWQRGRQTDLPDTQPERDAQAARPARPPDSEAPQGEEA
jgi:hypothetical protein